MCFLRKTLDKERAEVSLLPCMWRERIGRDIKICILAVEKLPEDSRGPTSGTNSSFAADGSSIDIDPGQG